MNLNTSNPVTEDGDYDLTNLHPGSEYLLTMKGDWGDGTLTLSFPNGPDGAFVPVDGGTWDGNGETEARFIAPSKTMRLTLDETTTTPNLKITVIPIA